VARDHERDAMSADHAGALRAAFMRGFGVALAEIWKLHHDGQMVRHLMSANGFALAEFSDVDLTESDYAAICQAVAR
jgi:hypothetical protein